MKWILLLLLVLVPMKHGDTEIGGRHTGPVSITLQGTDKEMASRLIPTAKKLLGNLKHRMQFNKLTSDTTRQQGVTSEDLGDGSPKKKRGDYLIVVSSFKGLADTDKILIVANKKEEEEEVNVVLGYIIIYYSDSPDKFYWGSSSITIETPSGGLLSDVNRLRNSEFPATYNSYPDFNAKYITSNSNPDRQAVVFAETVTDTTYTANGPILYSFEEHAQPELNSGFSYIGTYQLREGICGQVWIYQWLDCHYHDETTGGVGDYSYEFHWWDHHNVGHPVGEATGYTRYSRMYTGSYSPAKQGTVPICLWDDAPNPWYWEPFVMGSPQGQYALDGWNLYQKNLSLVPTMNDLSTSNYEQDFANYFTAYSETIYVHTMLGRTPDFLSSIILKATNNKVGIISRNGLLYSNQIFHLSSLGFGHGEHFAIMLNLSGDDYKFQWETEFIDSFKDAAALMSDHHHVLVGELACHEIGTGYKFDPDFRNYTGVTGPGYAVKNDDATGNVQDAFGIPNKVEQGIHTVTCTLADNYDTVNDIVGVETGYYEVQVFTTEGIFTREIRVSNNPGEYTTVMKIKVGPYTNIGEVLMINTA